MVYDASSVRPSPWWQTEGPASRASCLQGRAFRESRARLAEEQGKQSRISAVRAMIRATRGAVS